MNRFLPDSLLDALLRPFAMAAPDGWVYLEIIAPDLRFVFIALLLLLCASVASRVKAAPALWPLTAFLFVAFVPWLATSGNGRYFIPLLLLSGIVCVGLAHALPFSRGLRLSLALLMTLLQGFAVSQNEPWHPWNSWDFYTWREPPYYPVQLDAEAREQPATYVTLSTVSYSLIAPQFAPESHWLNLSSLLGEGPESARVQYVKSLLTSAERLRVVLPSASMVATAAGQPTPAALATAAKVMELHNLRFARPEGGCRLAPLREDAIPQPPKAGASAPAGPPQRPGFWICEAAYHEPPVQQEEAVDPRRLAVFGVLERNCPRLFPAGHTTVTRIPGGLLRHYAGADMRVYVYGDAVVQYKYYRALNPVALGSVDQVLAPDFRMNCDQVPGRSGLPWDRGL